MNRRATPDDRHDQATRIASLAPSATATLRALGLTDRLVATTAHCPVAAGERVGGWLNPDVDRLEAIDPDLLLTADALQADVRDELEAKGFDVHHVEATTLNEVLDSFAEIGAATGVPEAGARLASEARADLDAIERAVAERPRPVVYCEEWSDPPMAAGNWVPEAVELAGGSYPFVDAGERSREVSGESVEAHAPEHVVLHVCGRGDRVDPAVVTDRGWDLPAIQSGDVHVFDDSLLNQPSPRLIDGVERLARTIHPDAFD